MLIAMVLVFAGTALATDESCTNEKLNHLEQKILQMKAEIVQSQQRLEYVLVKISETLSTSHGDHIIFPDRLTALEQQLNCSCPNGSPSEGINSSFFETCVEALRRGFPTGSYKMRLPGGGGEEIFDAYCDQDTYDGGWLVVQSRVDGTVSFEKNWDLYRRGFGDPDKNYWIGLEKLHRLTAYRRYELRVELKDYAGTAKSGVYGEFVVGSESEHYQLKKVGTFSGTAGDSLKYHVGTNFSTYDKDNDGWSSNCAAETKGGWWLKNCLGLHWCNLNGVYGGGSQQSIVWYNFQGYTGLAGSRMLIR